MIIDSSALVSILKHESDARPLYSVILDADMPVMSAASLLEVSIVMRRLKLMAVESKIDDLISELAIELVPFNAQQARLAQQADRRFGKGSGHPAQLNFGDCMAYATAIDRGQPLLFKGNDFVHTDVKPAL